MWATKLFRTHCSWPQEWRSRRLGLLASQPASSRASDHQPDRALEPNSCAREIEHLPLESFVGLKRTDQNLQMLQQVLLQMHSPELGSAILPTFESLSPEALVVPGLHLQLQADNANLQFPLLIDPTVVRTKMKLLLSSSILGPRIVAPGLVAEVGRVEIFLRKSPWDSSGGYKKRAKNGAGCETCKQLATDLLASLEMARAFGFGARPNDCLSDEDGGRLTPINITFV
ncbi:hypothetical protein AXG93_725s1220 [Marchantia polymorpha subsp. ruderalis]|uniref:Uncharacterized protein n=1 Tax=Marchantia polymorpha subsp. ruderalis TaxID=1480154 RepID=A0A176WFM2_MARPO|nr:hypothetical protein AXG93_725s1220 [Marchantia polymorpha subsp. ruderalis]